MAKAKKKEKKKFKISLNLVLIIQLIVMLGVSIFTTNTVSNRTRDSSDAHMEMTTTERAQVIKNYVEMSERQLTDFSKARQVTDLLNKIYNRDNHLSDDDLPAGVKDATVEELTELAQAYTGLFAGDIPTAEGVWIGTWDTHILTHNSSEESIGMQLEEEPNGLEQLQQRLLSKNGVVNNGIIPSPSTGTQIISMCRAIYNKNGKAIGMVGMGIKTDGLINTLDKISGANKNLNDPKVKAKFDRSDLRNATYYMLDTENATYLFTADKEKVNAKVDIPELKELCEKFKGSRGSSKEGEDEGKIEYKVNGKEYVSSYVFMGDYQWLFLVNAPADDVYALTNGMRLYLIIFGYILLILTVVFFFINKRQEKINQKLVSTIAKNSQTRQSLNTAMFKDVLTNANNRVSFAMDMESADVSEQKPCYFMMFNILGFSEINTRFGNDAGDQLLVRTVDTLKDIFPGRAIYRTGSDEFVVMIPSEGGQPAPDQIMNDVNTAFRQLMVPEKIDNLGAIYPKYKIAVIRRSGPADTSVVAALKDMTNRKGEATYGMIDYREM